MTRPYGTPIRLDELRLALSARDLAILATLGRFRLATGVQLRRLHFLGHSGPEAAARAARRALRRLADMGLVDHLERRIGGVRAGSSGLVWHLSRIGWRMLAQVEGRTLPRRLDMAEPSLRTCDHRLAVTEVAMRLHEAVVRGGCDVISLDPEPSCWRTYLNAGGGVVTLKPDLFAVTAATGAEFEDVWFIEVDRATESRATVARKAEQYEMYRRSGREQQAQGVFPRVMWIVPDEGRAEVIREVMTSSGRVEANVHVAGTLEAFIGLVVNRAPP
jgi:hypothetical protein